MKGVQFKLDGQPVKVSVETPTTTVLEAHDRPVTRDDYDGTTGPSTYAAIRGGRTSLLQHLARHSGEPIGVSTYQM